MMPHLIRKITFTVLAVLPALQKLVWPSLLSINAINLNFRELKTSWALKFQNCLCPKALVLDLFMILKPTKKRGSEGREIKRILIVTVLISSDLVNVSQLL